MYSVKEVSRIFGVKVRTIRNWIAKGKLEAQKDERSRRWKISSNTIVHTLPIHEVKHDNED